MKISRQALEEVKAALEEYKKVVEATNLSRTTKDTYIDHPSAFVRWLYDDFEPGSRVK